MNRTRGYQEPAHEAALRVTPMPRGSSGRFARTGLLLVDFYLHGVDVGKLVARTLGGELSRLDLRLPPHEREDCEAYLVAEVWKLSRDFDPNRTPFEAAARIRVKVRLVDYQRQKLGRTKWVWKSHTYTKPPKPRELHLDAPVGHGDHPGTLGDTVSAQPGDLEAGGDTSLGWLVADRDRARDADFEALRREFGRRASERARASARRKRLARS